MFHLYWFGRGVFSTIQINQFDGALRLIAEHAVRQGWTLYKDISIVYPPGYALFFGQFSPEMRQSIAAISVLALVLFCVYVLKKTLNCTFYDWRISLFVLTTALWYQQISGDVFAVPLTITLIIGMKWGIERFRMNISILLVFFSALLVFFRWDFPILLLFLTGATAIYEWFILKKNSMFRVLIPVGVGVALGFIGLIIFSASIQVMSEAFESLFTIPTKIILPFRSLPLPSPWHSPKILNSLFYVSVGIWIMLAFMQKRKNISDVFVILSPLIFLLYATGRADWPHALPMFFMVGVVYLCSQIKQNIVILSIGVFIAMYGIRLLIPNISEHVGAANNMQSHIQECGEVVKNIPAQSFFVGREQYNKYIYNTAALYLTRQDLKPASPYISDEPGLQNSCTYGERIRQDLLAAKKPLLVFIELGEQPAEPNATRTMRSCGAIEGYIRVAPHDSLGFCKSYGQTFDIRVYR